MSDLRQSFITYRSFGAAGDGKTDDFAAISAAHDYANRHHLPVRADSGDCYYIGPRSSSAVIRTDTDWTGASFIIDDSHVSIEERTIQPFHVDRDEPKGIDLLANGITSLRESQASLPFAPGRDCYVRVFDQEKHNFIREGLNQDNGHLQTDCFLLRADGSVDPSTPIIWNFNSLSRITAYPLETETITIKGGTFTTIANREESKYNYYTTGILVTRSQVVIDGLTHYVEGELDHGAPYDGILQIYFCANVTVKNCLFTAHRTYYTIGSAGLPVPMGSYDIRCQSAIHTTFLNCSQTTDIMDRRYWGLFVSDFCKNLTLDGCSFSRFDAHMGVTNAIIRNCTLGHQCLNLIGHGQLAIEHSTLFGAGFINLRTDYGSSFRGDITVRDCTWLPASDPGNSTAFLKGSFHGGHDFGFPCYMPQHIVIDGLTVRDSALADAPDYRGICLFDNITPANMDDSFVYSYPYHITKTLEIRNFQSDSRKKWILSDNLHMFQNVKIKED